ncbi:MAG: type II toxin-antitoxin system RelE/ParE family toxin [Bacteroidetes bacterium]|nr:type II toxin-antitoxin system RelE/ParE family toxin [Bacteroidota bacterium]
MKLTWSDTAVNQLEAIADSLYQNNPDSAAKFVNNIMNRISNLKLFPEKGRVVPEINDRSLREIVYNKYRIVYRLSDKIEIVYIQHSAKPLDDTKFD